jgi:hypothetical protein
MPRRTASAPSQPPPEGPRPQVIIDFDSMRGLLFIVLKNIGERSAYRVGTVFDKPLLGLDGQKRISDMQLFRRVEFMPPGKEFRQLVDPVSVCVRQQRLSKVIVTVSYADGQGQSFTERIVHDLRIYRDLGYISIPDEGDEHGRSN